MRIERRGLGYVGTTTEEGISLTLSRLRESRGELHGMLTVERAPEGHQLVQSFNVSSGAARTAIARDLSARSNHVDWRGQLEEFCRQVLVSENAGEAFEYVGDRPARETLSRLVDPIMPRGVATTIYAPQGAGKSTLARAIAVGCETGITSIPGWTFERTPVLVLDWEADADEWNDGIARIAVGLGISPPRIRYRRCRRPLADQVEEIAQLVATEGIGLVEIDSVELAAGVAREGSDPAEKVQRLHAALRSVGATSLLLDHVTGAALVSEGPIARPYGSVMKTAWARAVFELRREREPIDGRSELLLLNAKMNDAAKLAPIGLAMVTQGAAGPIRFERTDVEAADLEKLLTHRARMARFLAAGARTVKEIAEALELKPNLVRTELGRGLRAGQFHELSDGRWVLAARQGDNVSSRFASAFENVSHAS